MLYHLEIENFYSVRDPQIVDLTVSRKVSDYPERFGYIFKELDLRAPKVMALYGANGSGKSTVLRALAFLTWFLKSSFGDTVPGLPYQRFNDE